MAVLMQSPLKLCLLATMLSATVSACNTYPSSTTSSASQAGAENAVGFAEADRAASEPIAPAPSDASPLPSAQPQLVKTGTLTLTVDSVEQSIEQILTIVRQQQGDLLELQDQLPGDPGSRQMALLQMRVPQQNLETLIKALKQVGTLQQQSISAEDVASQLVDHQARLRNLRKTETTLLEIMDRSGGIPDVLKVAQELSNVRNSIEQVDAQLQDLKNRVAYSVVTLHLQQVTATIPAEPGLSTQVQETWEQATHSVGGFTVGLMKLGLWLLAYSPYGLLLLLSLLLVRRWRSLHRTPVSNPEPPTSG